MEHRQINFNPNIQMFHIYLLTLQIIYSFHVPTGNLIVDTTQNHFTKPL